MALQLGCLAMPCGQISSPSIVLSVNPGEKLRDTIGKKLLLRANEIIPGGKLIIHIHSSLNCGNLSEKFVATLQNAKARMIARGELSQ